MPPIVAQDKGPSLDPIFMVEIKIHLPQLVVGHGLTQDSPEFISSLLLKDALVQVLVLVGGTPSDGA